MTIRVFISHSNIDSKLATRVAGRVKRHGLETYLDIIDDALLKDGPDLADHLLTRMSECQQLIAVLSDKTKGSWWVPWEIGAGSEKGFRMASYSREFVNLPSYLSKWPDLHSDSDIAAYCRLSQDADSELARRERIVAAREDRLDARKRQASDFHRRLKAQLGR